jgi:hypothetical protein
VDLVEAKWWCETVGYKPRSVKDLRRMGEQLAEAHELDFAARREQDRMRKAAFWWGAPKLALAPVTPPPKPPPAPPVPDRHKTRLHAAFVRRPRSPRAVRPRTRAPRSRRRRATTRAPDPDHPGPGRARLAEFLRRSGLRRDQIAWCMHCGLLCFVVDLYQIGAAAEAGWLRHLCPRCRRDAAR